MNANSTNNRRVPAGVGRLVRRLERERRSWARRTTGEPVVATEVAWRAGIAEGSGWPRLAIRKGV